ncbi:type I secretion C-terminal target domain-containing protein [Candidatus Ruthia endofausta]|uniref:Type I secretion C-terminal target domain-containing protein n=1 Tax=Candidatus Ruthia endofausta TaxID=2738852 RepID=A0A6N0HN16_9GAMM|nr:type I secretion C-terminal target domain-containing protein [Candidatus Ruthia endofausta]QKQ23742.1 type I secretion C-terminal target domain-containing protein [Candidatus Ruthia endofausta]
MKISTKDADTPLTGISFNDTFKESLGNNTLTENSGVDTFDYNAITDFVIGNGDKLNLKDLLSYQTGDTLNDFLSVTDGSSAGDVVINIEANNLIVL